MINNPITVLRVVNFVLISTRRRIFGIDNKRTLLTVFGIRECIEKTAAKKSARPLRRAIEYTVETPLRSFVHDGRVALTGRREPVHLKHPHVPNAPEQIAGMKLARVVGILEKSSQTWSVDVDSVRLVVDEGDA